MKGEERSCGVPGRIRGNAIPKLDRALRGCDPRAFLRRAQDLPEQVVIHPRQAPAPPLFDSSAGGIFCGPWEVRASNKSFWPGRRNRGSMS